MATHTATVRWSASPGEDFAKGQYSRAHEWLFDGGAVVRLRPPRMSSPRPGPTRRGSIRRRRSWRRFPSCHMLFFLDFARRAGVVVTSYEDEAEGVMEKGPDGRVRITKVTLRPRIVFGGTPDPATLDDLHHKAHEACFIANSVTSEVVVEPR